MQKDILSENLFNLNSQNKLIFFGIIISSVVIVFTAWLVISSNQQTITESYHNFGRVVAKSLAAQSNYIILHSTSKQTQQMLEEVSGSIIHNNKDISAIIFALNDGREYKFYSREQQEPEIIDKERVFAPIFRDISTHNDQIGTVNVYLTGYTKKLVGRTTRNSLCIIFLIAWVIAIFAVWLNTYLITRNLSHIVEGVKRVSIGEFGYRVLSKDLWGEVKQLVEAFNDMSGKLQNYEEKNIDQLTYERNKIESVLYSIANGVVVCDRCDEIIIVNDAAVDMLYSSSEHLIGLKIQEYVDEKGKHCFSELVKSFKETPLEHLEKEPLYLQVEISNRTFKAITSPIFDFHQEYLGYTLILHDITKEIEIDRMKSEFISNVSHELRTPVTVLRSYVDTLAHYGEEFDADTKKEFMVTIDDHVNRLNSMVNSILDFSKLQKEELELQLQKDDLLPIIQLTIKSIEKLAEDKNIKISTAYETDLPQVLIHHETIEKVMRNLLSNAIKYTPEDGKIKIKVELDRTGQYVEVSVIDTGIGIAKEDLPRLFDRFFRVENKVHTEVGTGIGLEIVKKAIEKHNGEIFVDSDLGKGSTFGFKLPVASTDDEDMIDDDTSLFFEEKLEEENIELS